MHQLPSFFAQQHQLPSFAEHPTPASIMSISCPVFLHNAPRQPASRASAAQLFGSTPHASQHHEHQLPTFLAPHPMPASIMSISCPAFLLNTPRQPASWASAAQLFGSTPHASQHHEHQLPSFLAPHPTPASIMSISCPAFWLNTPRQPASRASAAQLFCSTPNASRHHEHQLPSFFAQHPTPASIMSISCPPFWLHTPRQPAS